MLIIGFGHRARQGKNSAALALANAVPAGSRVRTYAYADALRAEVNREVSRNGGLAELVKRGWFIGDSPKVRTCFRQGLPPWVKAEDGKPRTLLQWWGTDYRRAQDVDYWVRQLMERIALDQPDVALITDVRFANEVDAIHNAGGYAVKVQRTTPPDIVVPPHPSEDELEGYTGWDYEIKAADIAELRAQGAHIYRRITTCCAPHIWGLCAHVDNEINEMHRCTRKPHVTEVWHLCACGKSWRDLIAFHRS